MQTETSYDKCLSVINCPISPQKTTEPRPRTTPRFRAITVTALLQIGHLRNRVEQDWQKVWPQLRTIGTTRLE